MTDRSDYGACKRRRSESFDPGNLYRKHLIKESYRIRSANILLITIKALANEVAKNLVLAGIGSLTIIDHEPVTETDLDAQFFLEEAHKNEDLIKEGKNVITRCP